jgi:hypothetical protein
MSTFEYLVKASPYIFSSALLSGVYYTAFNLYDESVLDSNWIFMYRFLQSVMTVNLMSLSWISKKNPDNFLVNYLYMFTLVSFYSMTTLVLYNDYFTEMRNEDCFDIIQKVYYTSISSMVNYYVFYEAKTNIQGAIKMYSRETCTKVE